MLLPAIFGLTPQTTRLIPTYLAFGAWREHPSNGVLPFLFWEQRRADSRCAGDAFYCWAVSHLDFVYTVGFLAPFSLGFSFLPLGFCFSRGLFFFFRVINVEARACNIV